VQAIDTPNRAISWALLACRSSSQASPFAFRFPIEEDSFEALCAIQYKAHSLEEIIFLLRLAQIPILADSKKHA